MPLYEYQCEDCGLTFEVRQKYSDEPIETCRHCGGHARKMISQVAFALKGGGWYEEGYSHGDSRPIPAASSSDACSSCVKEAHG
ncbi:MAG: zinc ribbon domain-containing protein [Desulfuromusa sp.]|nr:zinc ribbon domain-containing protein [Desulfuromusa sp.]